jgi:DNA polymerase-3 subunit alpha
MAVIQVEDMEGEVSCVIFPNLYETCADTLAGNVNAETGESEEDVFVRVTGKLERSDRGVQIICSAVEALELTDATNKPKVIELSMPSSRLSRGCMEKLGYLFGRYEGMDTVEIVCYASTGETVRLALPVKVDAHNDILLQQVRGILGRDGEVVCV